jgi:hypothetical protein
VVEGATSACDELEVLDTWQRKDGEQAKREMIKWNYSVPLQENIKRIRRERGEVGGGDSS